MLLERQDLILDRPALPAMIAPLNHPNTFARPDDRIRVWRAGSLSDLSQAGKIRNAAFRLPKGAAVEYFKIAADDWLTDSSPARLYLAAWRDEPAAAIGALVMGAGMPGVYVMATLPEYRRSGLGAAVLKRILHDALHKGGDTIALTASRFGYPLYARFGFMHLFDYRLYRLK